MRRTSHRTSRLSGLAGPAFDAGSLLWPETLSLARRARRRLGGGFVAATAIPLVLLISACGLRSNAQDINVKNYGAKGNGSSDDTAAIQRAFNAAARDHKNVYFPAGTYVLGTIRMKDGIREIHGQVSAAGNRIATLKQKALGADLLRTDGAMNDVTIDHLRFIGIGGDNHTDFNSAIRFCCGRRRKSSHRNITIEDNEFRFWQGTAIGVSDAADVLINNNWVHNLSNGIGISDCSHCTISNNLVENPQIRPYAGYIDALMATGDTETPGGHQHNDHILFYHNTVRNSYLRRAFDEHAITVHDAVGLTIDANSLINVSTGLCLTVIDPPYYSTHHASELLENVIVSDNTIVGASRPAFNRSAIFDNTTMRIGGPHTGYYTMNNVKIIDNHFSKAGYAWRVSWNGAVTVEHPVNHLAIADNTFEDNQNADVLFEAPVRRALTIRGNLFERVPTTLYLHGT